MPGIRKGAESHIFMLANKVKQEKEKTTLLTITLSIEFQTYLSLFLYSGGQRIFLIGLG